MRPFIFPKYFDDATLEDIRETKRQTEAMIAQSGAGEREVKLGRGGIRDIEFTVQMLQLLNGGRWPELRTPNTLAAIDALQQCHCLRPFEANVLERHYIFLRQIEHRLQIEDGRQCHALPEDAGALSDFARRLGYEDGESFLRVYHERAQETREILDQFLATKGSGHLWVGDLLNPLSDGAAGLKHLAEIGLKEPQRAREELLQLATGNERRPFTRHVHQRFSEIAPFLLNALSFMPQPDAILTRLSRILSGLVAPATLYELLHQNPVLCHFIVTLVANSEYLCSILVREPDLLDQLSNVDALDRASTRRDLTEELRSLNRAVESDAALYRLRDGEMLRIAARDLVRNITLAQVGDELTQLAEVVLEEALRQAREKASERYGPAETPFAILGLGKLGGWEMGYGSDLDLVFVYAADAPPGARVSNSEYFAAVAAHTIRILKEPTRYGVLYDIDARLRPDGKKGILAIDDQRLGQYYREEAQPWERHALMKVRAVAGDAAFAAKVEQLAKDVAFSLPLDQTTLDGIETLRRRMVEQASPLDLKKCEGGLAEIEFATRFYQLRYAPEYPALRRGDVFGALDILHENSLIEPAHYAGLRRPYGELRRILNRIRMMHGSHTTELPAEADARAELASRLSITGDLLEYVQERRAQVHNIYRQVLDWITTPRRH